MGHNELFHQDLHCLPFCFCLRLKPLFVSADMSKLKDWRVQFRNSGLKGSKQSTSCQNCLHVFAILMSYWKQINLGIPGFLKWTLSSMNMVRTIVPNRDLCHKSKQNGKQCRYWWDGSRAISSWSTLFCKNDALVHRAERLNKVNYT